MKSVLKSEIKLKKMSKKLIDKWLGKLRISKWLVDTKQIDPKSVTYPDDIPAKDKFFVGIQSAEEALHATIFHDRPLTEEDIVHELLHIKHPDWSEEQINAVTKRLLQPTNVDKSNRFTMCHLGDEITELVKNIGNDQELGTKVRALVTQYKNK